MGRPPGDGFSQSRGWLVSGLYVGRACALRLPTQASLGSRDPPLRCLLTYPCGVTLPTLVGSRDPPLRGLVTHPWEVTCPTLEGSHDPP